MSNLHNDHKPVPEFGPHPIYGGHSWGILHEVDSNHNKTYTVNYGGVSKADIDSGSGNIYIDRSVTALKKNDVRWSLHTDHHRLAKIVWAHHAEITATLAKAGFTCNDNLEISAVHHEGYLEVNVPSHPGTVENVHIPARSHP
jgi:hypothetical protein